ncbi:C4-dicarboxylate ABC transporter substrate-binding protein, partial [Cribrihabitans sp. XS_ASV171]
KEAIAAIYKERFGIEKGSDAASALTEGLAKWTDLTKDVSSAEELAEVYWNEIFSKVDVSSYGS